MRSSSRGRKERASGLSILARNPAVLDNNLCRWLGPHRESHANMGTSTVRQEHSGASSPGTEPFALQRHSPGLTANVECSNRG
jgi:hypothetical protein